MEVFWERALFAIIAALIGTCVTLFVRVRTLEAKRAAADVRLDHLEKGSGHGISATELAEHKLDCERRFVTRDDWVPVNSLILGNQEKQSAALNEQGKAIARIEAGMQARESAR